MAEFFRYGEERFENAVDHDLHCVICMNVLKEPVMCQNNQHYFCKACITRHLVQSEMCPTCREELNVETLKKPPRILMKFLSNLNIRCENYERGCLGFVKLGDIRNHTGNCGFAPVKCSNDGCSIEVNKRDRIYHETEVSEFRKVKCHDCAELKKDFVEVKNDCAELKKDFVEMKNDCAELKKDFVVVKNDCAELKKDFVEVKRDCDEIKRNYTKMKRNYTEMKRNYTEMKKEIEEVKNNANEIKDNQKKMMKELMSLTGMMVQIKELVATDKVEGAAATSCASASSPSTCVSRREDIVIAGGKGHFAESHSSVEMFTWHNKTWVGLNSMKKRRVSPVSFVHGNTMIVAGGNGRKDDMERMVLKDEQEKQNWLRFPAKLPKNLEECRCVNFEDRLILVGGYIQFQHSDAIYEVLLHPPYTVKHVSRLPQGRSCHGAERFNKDILIIGGYTSNEPCDSVVLYDVNRNVYKQMPPLPYTVCDMATVTYGEFIVLVGGRDPIFIKGTLNTVCMYNMRNGSSKMLPSMRHKRYRCTAVVTGNSIVVMGGEDDEDDALNSVECYSFDTNTWEELPPMNESRSGATSIVKTVN